jgi:hypothetical protein
VLLATYAVPRDRTNGARAMGCGRTSLRWARSQRSAEAKRSAWFWAWSAGASDMPDEGVRLGAIGLAARPSGVPRFVPTETIQGCLSRLRVVQLAPSLLQAGSSVLSSFYSAT